MLLELFGIANLSYNIDVSEFDQIIIKVSFSEELHYIVLKWFVSPNTGISSYV